MRIAKIEKHAAKSWEVSIMELSEPAGKKYKVTRRFPELKIAETKVFCSKKEARMQFDEWLK